MLYDKVMIRFGDLSLKGKNKKYFVHSLFLNLVRKFNDLPIKVKEKYDFMLLENIEEVDSKIIVERLNTVSGISSFSFVKESVLDMLELKENCVDIVECEIDKNKTFKVESKRSNKHYPFTSQEVSILVADYIMKSINDIYVDVRNPDQVLTVHVKNARAYIYMKKYKGLGGFPCGVAGSGLSLLSGGIDSPVASFLCQKQGVQVEGLHFESTPMTSVESAQKVYEIAKKLSLYSGVDKFKLHIIHFREIHEMIMINIPDAYHIIIMRRIMYKIAEKLAKKMGHNCIITGESIGQVASQTLESILAANHVTNFPVMRPLCTYDKLDIIEISKKIDTYDISILPYEDCCTVYLPKKPVTKPNLKVVLDVDKMYNFDNLIEKACEEFSTLTVKLDSDFVFADKGFDLYKILKNNE